MINTQIGLKHAIKRMYTKMLAKIYKGSLYNFRFTNYHDFGGFYKVVIHFEHKTKMKSMKGRLWSFW